MNEGRRDAVGRVCGSPVLTARPIQGGDINDAHQAELADGRTVFVKANAAAPAGMFTAEAEGLAWLRDARALRVPEVVGLLDPSDPVGPTGPTHPTDRDERLLVLEWIEPGPTGATHDEALGRGLAALHQAGAPCFGKSDGAANFIGTLPQANAPQPTWPEFYVRERLEPLLTRAVACGALPADAPASVARLAARLADLYPEAEPPARLHGDLWVGNVMAGPGGTPVIVDPAPSGGHREMDLAMMQLFGGFSPRVFAAYDEVHPRLEGHTDRVALHQLYPLLVHTVLFGGSYGEATMRALNRYR